MQDIQSFAKQCMQAMCFLHGTLRLAHTDLKPENILFRFPDVEAVSFQRDGGRDRRNSKPYLRPKSAEVKVIDYGNATFDHDHHASIINTRQYRGPEVILNTGWDHPSDLWSLGCILVELYTGSLLFATHDNSEHLALMERTLGPMPEKFAKHIRAQGGDPSLAAGYRWLKPDSSSSKNWAAVDEQRVLDRHVRPEHRLLTDLVRELLMFDPAERATAGDALHHRFLSERMRE